MEPSFWHRVETIDAGSSPGIYAIADAFCKINHRYANSNEANNTAFLPWHVIGFFTGEPPATAIDIYELPIIAAQMIWQSQCSFADKEQMLNDFNDYESFIKIAEERPDQYSVSMCIKNTSSTLINQIDLNFYLYAMVRVIYREEAQVFVRVADSEGLPIFIDEVNVSPTIISDFVLSPMGGFIIRFERNSNQPLYLDFGPVSEGGEHVLRVNDAYRQPGPVPPLDEFKWNQEK